ncbi:MAG: CotH kinase family protein, partial [Vicingaceae bacterium]|nr:CotH kinase family protein [Vicingaceae bacterium]
FHTIINNYSSLLNPNSGYRGNSSAWYDKKSFALKFSEKQCFRNFDCAKRWNLNAEYKERTFMRNKISYDLFSMFSENNYAPQIIYASVYLNNNYNGIYTLTERVDAKRLKLAKNDTNAVLFKEAPISFPTEEHEKRHKEFIEFYHWHEFFKAFPEKGFKKLIAESYYNQRHPSIKKSNKKQVIHELTDFIFYSSDEDFNNEQIFNTYFDLTNVIDWHLLLLISNNSDGLAKNFYIYKLNKNTPFRFSPWDYDHGYGRDGDGELNDTSFIDVSRVKLLDRLLKTNALDYKRKLYNRFIYLKTNNILTYPTINKMIDENTNILTLSMSENNTKWPIDSISTLKGSSFDDEVLLLKKWIKMRLVRVENYLHTLSTSK